MVVLDMLLTYYSTTGLLFTLLSLDVIVVWKDSAN